jgi:hypothetical protein
MRVGGFKLEDGEAKSEAQMKEMERWARTEVITWAATARKHRGEQKWMEIAGGGPGQLT